MQKGVVFNIKRYAIHDGPGIRTTLFLSGCPLRCWWCHNPEAIRDDPAPMLENASVDDSGEIMTVREAVDAIEKDVLFYDESGGGVTFSGGEPLVQHRFLKAVLRECRKRDIHTVLDTTGYASPEIVESVVEDIGLFLYDLKLMDNRKHLEYTGFSNELIKNNLTLLVERGRPIVIRFPMIPEITDTEENISQISDFVFSLKRIDTIHILPYHRTAEAKYRRLKIPNRMKKIRPPSRKRVNEVKANFEKRGFTVIVGG